MCYPILWFEEDVNGGWNRLNLKLSLHNLHFDGGLVSSSKKAAADHIKDLIEAARAQGASTISVPKKAMPFGNLITHLETHGLLPSGENQQEAADPAVGELSAAHRAQVLEHMRDVERGEVQEPAAPLVPHNVLAPVVQELMGDIPPNFVIAPLNEDEVAVPPHIEQPPANVPPPVDEEVAITLRNELEAAMGRNHALESELAQMRTTCLMLENSANTDHGRLTDRVGEIIASKFDEGIKTLEKSIMANVAKEVRLEIHRHTDRTMEMIHLIPTINKNLNKAIETKEGSGYTINELAKHVALNAAEIKKIGDSTSQIRTLISANNALIKHVLTANSNVAPSIGGPPLTPLQTPKKARIICDECGLQNHAKRDCPTKMEFCARCLDRSHKTFACPSYGKKCEVCDFKGLGELAYGHNKIVHQEADVDKRKRIKLLVGPTCFPDWN